MYAYKTFWIWSESHKDHQQDSAVEVATVVIFPNLETQKSQPPPTQLN